MDIVKANPFTGVAANALATTQFIPDRDLAVYGLILALGGGTPAFSPDLIDRITIKSGGKELFRLTGTQMNEMNEYDGIQKDLLFISVNFADPTARTARGEHLGTFDMTIYRDPLTIEVLIGNVLVSPPTLEAFVQITPPKLRQGFGYTPDEAQVHRALIETVIQPSAAVVRKAFGIGLGSEAGALIRKIVFFHLTLTSLAVKRNGLDIFDDVDEALNDFVQQDVYARVTNPALYAWDPTVNGNQSEARTTVNPDGTAANYQILVTDSAADTITVLADVYSKLPLL